MTEFVDLQISLSKVYVADELHLVSNLAMYSCKSIAIHARSVCLNISCIKLQYYSYTKCTAFIGLGKLSMTLLNWSFSTSGI